MNVDERVVSRAKRYAKQQGVSVSQMVEAYLEAVAEPAADNAPDAPILRSLKRISQEGECRILQAHLTAKYR